jgi:hypothetical protein
MGLFIQQLGLVGFEQTILDELSPMSCTCCNVAIFGPGFERLQALPDLSGGAALAPR